MQKCLSFSLNSCLDEKGIDHSLYEITGSTVFVCFIILQALSDDNFSDYLRFSPRRQDCQEMKSSKLRCHN